METFLPADAGRLCSFRYLVFHNSLRYSAVMVSATPDSNVSTANAAVTVAGLTVMRGGQPVLNDISMVVPSGRITGVVGPSGSGKTTLLRSIVGCQIVASGDVEVLGARAGTASLRRRIGYMTQSLGVYADLTVTENLGYFASVLGLPRQAGEEVTRVVGLASHAHRLVRELSDGQRTRVSLAAALLGNPDLLVLDEPTVGLDPVLRRNLWATFAAVAASGKTLLVASHVMDEAARCDNLLLLHGGRVVATGSPASLCEATGASDVEGAFLRLLEAEGIR